MNADYVEVLVRLAGALVVLSALLAGQGGRWPRARQRLARALSSFGGTSRGSSSTAGPSPSPGENRRAARERRRALVRELAIALWLAILLAALVVNLRDEFPRADSGRAPVVSDF